MALPADMNMRQVARSPKGKLKRVPNIIPDTTDNHGTYKPCECLFLLMIPLFGFALKEATGLVRRGAQERHARTYSPWLMVVSYSQVPKVEGHTRHQPLACVILHFEVPLVYLTAISSVACSWRFFSGARNFLFKISTAL